MKKLFALAPAWPERLYDPAAVFGENWAEENWGSNG